MGKSRKQLGRWIHLIGLVSDCQSSRCSKNRESGLTVCSSIPPLTTSMDLGSRGIAPDA